MSQQIWRHFMRPECRLRNIYHENTKIGATDMPVDSGQFGSATVWRDHRKVYANRSRVRLEDPRPDKCSAPLAEVIAQRRSCRDFTGEPLELWQLSTILHFSGGIRPRVAGDAAAFRMYPSAGALFPLEMYVASFSCKDLEPGLYHFSCHGHFLTVLAQGCVLRDFHRYVNSQDFVLNASSAIIITAFLERTCGKYGDRGYRYVLLDAGHLVQNIYLSSAALGLGCCTIGGFYDDSMNRLLGVDSAKETVVYIAIVGVRGRE